MNVFGILGIVQMAVLPGLVLLSAVRFRSMLLNAVICTFALSFAINYALVTLLVACGTYTREAVLAVISAELVAMVSLRGRITIDRGDAERTHPLMGLASVSALGAIAWALIVWVRSLGMPFVTWDAIHSWNRWANVFAGGAMPRDIQYYPQLVPANWSIGYVLMKSTSVETFAKAPMGAFFLLTLIAIAGAGVHFRDPALLFGTALTALLERKCVGEFLTDGYVDVPVTFFATVSTVLLLSSAGDPRTLWMSCAIAAAAALTKQAGGYFFLVWPLLAVGLGGAKTRAAMRMWVTLLIAPLAFYVAQYVAILGGTNYSNIAYVTHDIYRGATIPQRALLAFRSLGIYVTVFAFAAAALPLVPRYARRLLLVVGLPFTIIWACYFSYDRRNVALALPFIGVGAAAGAVELFDRARLLIQRRK